MNVMDELMLVDLGNRYCWIEQMLVERVELWLGI
jgi:hypothetical protein